MAYLYTLRGCWRPKQFEARVLLSCGVHGSKDNLSTRQVMQCTLAPLPTPVLVTSTLPLKSTFGGATRFLSLQHLCPFAGGKGKALAQDIAREHGVRAAFSGLDGFGMQPLDIYALLTDPYLFNSIQQAMYPDIMHVFPGGIWQKILQWMFVGESLDV